MKLNALTIRRFGRFERKQITLPDTPLVMIYGENESGKSTMMAFIVHQLFGFSGKKTVEQWQGHGDSQTIGGSITFTGDDGNVYHLERHFNGQEQLDFHLSNGTAVHLDTLLHGMNRMLFQSVFCFDLDGLRDIDKKSPADLNDLLLGAGMIGSGTLGKLEQTLEKQCAELFKKKGKKPDINQRFTQLNACSAELRAWEKKMDDYQELQQRIQEGSKRLEALEATKRKLQQAFQWWTAFSAARPLIQSRQLLEQELRQLQEDPPFPQQGKQHYDDLRKQINTKREELAQIDEQISQLQAAQQEIKVDLRWQRYEAALQHLFKSAIEDEQNENELRRVEAELREQKTACQRICDYLGAHWSETAIRQASSDLSLPKQLKIKIGNWNEKQNEQRDLVHDQSAASEHSDKLNAQLKNTETKKAAQEQIAQRRSEKTRFRHNQAPMGVLIGATALLALSSALLITPLAAVPVLFLGAGILVGLYFFSSPGNRTYAASGEEERLDSQRMMIQQQLVEARDELAGLNQRVSENQQMIQTLEQEIKSWLSRQGYAIERLHDAEEKVRLVENGQEICRKMDQLKDQRKQLSAMHQAFLDETRTLAEQLGVPGGDADYLKERSQRELAQLQNLEDLEKQCAYYETHKERQLHAIHALTQQQARLLKEADADSEAHFYALAERDARRCELENKSETARNQLLDLTGSEERIRAYEDYLKNGNWEAESEQTYQVQLSACESELKSVRDQLAADRASSATMEANDSYRDTLDRYHTLVTDAGIKAKDWAVLQTALWAIRKAKENYREQRLPHVLTKAAEYFSCVTDHRYVRLTLNDSGFMAEQADGVHVPAANLSRGTAEQLYLCLRLALMDAFHGYETMPMIVDDSFVNFDALRTKKVYALLEKIAAQRQVIIFTCHKTAYLKEHAETVLNLSKQRNETVSN